MTELKLKDIKGLLPEKYEVLSMTTDYRFGKNTQRSLIHANNLIDELSTKNLLDYIEAVVCEQCCGDKGILNTSVDRFIKCPTCRGAGAVIRVKESKNESSHM